MPRLQRQNKELVLGVLDEATPDVIETARQILPKAIERIRDPANFCVGALTKDEYGNKVDPSYDGARQSCVSDVSQTRCRASLGRRSTEARRC